MDDFDVELKTGFLDEAAQAVADVEQCFLDLEENPTDMENLNKIFRLAHNLKGSSKAVGFDKFGEFTHQFESFILKVKNNELEATPKVVSLLLRANDHIAYLIQELKKDLGADCNSSDLINELANFEQSNQEPELVDVKKLSDEVEIQIPTDVNLTDLSIEEIQKLILEQDLKAEHTVLKEAPAKIEIKSASSPLTVVDEKQNKTAPTSVGEESIRVSLSKVEKLINFVGEMTILQSVLKEQAQNSDSPLLKKTVHQIGKVGKEIQDLSMGLRMIPVKPTFQKMQRIVRDTAQALGKEVAITLIGEETELDKTVLEKINDPLVHLIRNSIDHGIETPERRAAAGKTAKGQVKLAAYHNAGKLVLEISDDGAGLDPEKLKKKAIEKGILKPENNLSDKEAMALIFAPGFSTKEQVTDVSGRGVGMDVVRTNIHELSGEVLIDSVVGKGTTFKIILPLTLAIIDAMILLCGQEKFVIPLNHVHETLRPLPDQVVTGPLGNILLLREENIPMFLLGDFFGLKSTNKITEMISIVVKSGPKPFVIVVDDILDQSQVVTKQLGVELQGIKGISASTILGDGKPALILEPQELLQKKNITKNIKKGAA